MSYTANTVPADALATLGARASADIVITPKAGIFSSIISLRPGDAYMRQ